MEENIKSIENNKLWLTIRENGLGEIISLLPTTDQNKIKEMKFSHVCQLCNFILGNEEYACLISESVAEMDEFDFIYNSIF